MALIEKSLGDWNIKEGIVFVWVDQAMNELNVQRANGKARPEHGE